MVKNDFEIDVKVKCLEERITQAQLAEMVGTSASYISRLINKKNSIVNKTFVEMLEKLGEEDAQEYVRLARRVMEIMRCRGETDEERNI